VVVASAGNDATSRPAYPAAQPGVIGVAAVGPAGPAPFTNYGSWVTACAPGVDVVSHFYTGIDEHDDHDPATSDFRGWAKWCGTSFAGPIVAGAIAREAGIYGISVAAAVERVVNDERLLRLPGLGTVVNVH
jgi:subtilisin family serine protease